MPVRSMIRLSLALRNFNEFVGRWGSWFILPLVGVTIWDVAVRKLGGIQYWLIQTFGSAFESTIIQELEWHFHTALFALVLGYGYVNNKHVRVDLVREKLSFRKQVWIEFLGCTFFLIPYCMLVGYFAFEYAYDSFMVGEISASTVGLPYRWIIKSVLVLGLIVAGLAGVSVWLQTVLVLFGPDVPLIQQSTERFAEKDLLTDADGANTGTAGATYVKLAVAPTALDKIAVSDARGAMNFRWVENSPIVHFPALPTSARPEGPGDSTPADAAANAITVSYEHKIRLMTLEWPEDQAAKKRLRDAAQAS